MNSKQEERQIGVGLDLKDVHAGYNHIPVLRGVSLHAEPGESVALLGPNGVGKTTTMRVITGVVRPTAGAVTWEGAALAGLPPHKIASKGIAIVPEGRRLYLGMTVEDNLKMGAYQRSRAETEIRLENIFTRFPLLLKRRTQIAGTLSGGQQQVCAIARALMSNPRLLLIDELSLGLSPLAIMDVLDAIKIAIEILNPTILIVDQDVNVAAELATRGYFMEQGALVAEGKMEELIRVDRIRDLYFSTDGETHKVSHPA